MLDDRRLVKVSKYLSRHLRHAPERLGLELEPGGGGRGGTLLRAGAGHSFRVTEAELREVVARNDKQRFAFDATGARIRGIGTHPPTPWTSTSSWRPRSRPTSSATHRPGQRGRDPGGRASAHVAPSRPP